MSGINKIILAGHIGEGLKFSVFNLVALMRFPLATMETVGKGDNKKELTEWHNVVLWRCGR